MIFDFIDIFNRSVRFYGNDAGLSLRSALRLEPGAFYRGETNVPTLEGIHRIDADMFLVTGRITLSIRWESSDRIEKIFPSELADVSTRKEAAFEAGERRFE